MKACKHLDYDVSKYPRCVLKNLADQGYSEVRYWDRYEGGFVTQKELEVFPNTAIRVQFCKKEARINEILACYIPEEMGCYELGE